MLVVTINLVPMPQLSQEGGMLEAVFTLPATYQEPQQVKSCAPVLQRNPRYFSLSARCNHASAGSSNTRWYQRQAVA